MKKHRIILTVCILVCLIFTTTSFASTNDLEINTNAITYYTVDVERSDFQTLQRVFYGYYDVTILEYFQFPSTVTPVFPAKIYYSEPAPNGNGDASGILYLIEGSEQYIRTLGGIQEWFAIYAGTVGYVIE
ncbi:MAG: hypothetical protein WDA11_09580 [Thiohalomonadaceae bacterium]